MATRRRFLRQVGAASLILTGSASTQIGWTSGRTGSLRSPITSPSHAIKGAVRREETIVRYAVHGDNWHMTWGADDRQYVSMCDGAGFWDPPKEFHNSRILAVSGGPRDARFQDLSGYPTLARPRQREDEARYYGFGTLAAAGNIYQFLSTFNRSLVPGELEHPDLAPDLLRFNGAKLIYSPDAGRTWHNHDGSTPVVWEPWDRRSRETMVFFEEDQGAFALLTVLQMGKNYEQNRDGYVYVYAPNGIAEGTMSELVMFRVPHRQVLDRAAYEYFAGLKSNGSAKWSRDISARRPVHTFPRGWVNRWLHPFAWHPSVVYNAPLGVYMMANWAPGVAPNGAFFGKPSYLGLWIAQNPWGPWTQILEEQAWLPGGEAAARAYEPQIAPKWIAPDGKSFWLVWTDAQVVTDGAAMKQLSQERERNGYPNTWSQDYATRYALGMRRDLPYYAFNCQRVDFSVD